MANREPLEEAIREIFDGMTAGEVASRLDPIPALGEHTEKVLAELGFPEDAVQRLRADGVV